MKKVIAFLSLFIIIGLPVFSQESTAVTGKVITENTQAIDDAIKAQKDAKKATVEVSADDVKDFKLSNGELKELIKINATSNWALFLGAGLAIGLAGLGAGIGMGSAIRGGLEGISRNPGVAGKIFTYLLVGVALIESIAIYGLVVSLILLFVK